MMRFCGAMLGAVEIGVPVEARRIGRSSAVAIGLLILSMSRRSATGQLTFAIAGLERHDRVGVLRGPAIADHRQRPLDVGAIRVALRLERR